MKHVHFLISLFIWLFAFLPVVALSFIVVPILLCMKTWDGTTTMFGNTKYPRMEACHHYSYPTYMEFWREIHFYCVRNPVSNYGRIYLANHQPWAWEYRNYIVGPFTIDFGWALGNEPKFKFRPRINK